MRATLSSRDHVPSITSAVSRVLPAFLAAVNVAGQAKLETLAVDKDGERQRVFKLRGGPGEKDTSLVIRSVKEPSGGVRLDIMGSNGSGEGLLAVIEQLRKELANRKNSVQPSQEEGAQETGDDAEKLVQEGIASDAGALDLPSKEEGMSSSQTVEEVEPQGGFPVADKVDVSTPPETP